jgi:hypothetical protein
MDGGVGGPAGGAELGGAFDRLAEVSEAVVAGGGRFLRRPGGLWRAARRTAARGDLGAG